jgi:hypothetical protein
VSGCLAVGLAQAVIPPWIAIVIEVLGLIRLAIGACVLFRIKITQALIRDLLDG